MAHLQTISPVRDRVKNQKKRNSALEITIN
jgi:hypothetical protein